MDYIPVYADEHESEGTVKVSLDKIQRTGVRPRRSQKALSRAPSAPPARSSTTRRLLTIVTVRSDGYIEELFVNKTGQHVKEGEPLFRFYSPQIQLAQADLLVAVMRTRDVMRGRPRRWTGRDAAVAEPRLSRKAASTRCAKDSTNPRTIDWPSPATGDVIEKKVIKGQRVTAGDELYRIADHSLVWVIADVAESDIAVDQAWQRARVTSARPSGEPRRRRGDVHLSRTAKPETRTCRCASRSQIPRGGSRCVDMYADVMFDGRQSDAGDRRPSQRGDRQRHAAGGPRCQRRGPLRAARREARPPRRGICRNRWTV